MLNIDLGYIKPLLFELKLDYSWNHCCGLQEVVSSIRVLSHTLCNSSYVSSTNNLMFTDILC